MTLQSRGVRRIATPRACAPGWTPSPPARHGNQGGASPSPTAASVFAIMVTNGNALLRRAPGPRTAAASSSGPRARAFQPPRPCAPRARKNKLPFAHLPWNDRAQAEARALRLLEECQIEFHRARGRFMKILSPNFVWRYKNKIINIHPSVAAAEFSRPAGVSSGV